MKKEIVLKKVIQKAIDGGWLPKIQWKANPELYQSAIIFDHSFAKAFWKNTRCECWHCKGKKLKPHRSALSWRYYIRQLAISKDRLAYLSKFVKGE